MSLLFFLYGLAEISRDDLWVAANFRRRTLSNFFAVIQNQNSLAEVHHEFHIVLNEQNRNAEHVANFLNHLE